jgi:hypothetical protein
MITDSLFGTYESILHMLPENLRIIPPLFLVAIAIAIYSIFIWFFYRFLSRRDVLKLNLAKYNTYKHSGVIKFFRVLFYIIEFIIISPVAIFFWFAILSIFMIVLAKGIEVGTIILICAALISAIRITSYFNEDLSRDLSKMVPFTLLGVTLLTPNFLDIETSIARVAEISLFFNNAIYYLLFIIALETLLRLFYLPFNVAEYAKVKE